MILPVELWNWMDTVFAMHYAYFSFLYFNLQQDRDNYWSMMQKYIGSDVTSMVTLPVLIFEPMTMLQRMAEVCVQHE